MRHQYSPAFRTVATTWADAYDWEISDTTFWFNKVFGESFADGGITTANPRHHVVYERKNTLCNEEFRLCPNLEKRDFRDGKFDKCRSCIA